MWLQINVFTFQAEGEKKEKLMDYERSVTAFRSPA